MNLYRIAACLLLLACAATRALAQTNPCRISQPVSTLGSTPVPQAPSASFTALTQSLSPSFFVFSDGLHVAAVHLDATLVGPASFSVPGYPFSPAQPGETISIYANGFGPTSIPVAAGSGKQGGTLSPLPAITIAGRSATVLFAGLTSAGLFQFNVMVPGSVPQGDQIIKASYGGASTQPGTLLTIHP